MHAPSLHPTEMLIRRLRVDTSLSEDAAQAMKSLPVYVRDVPADTIIVSEGDRPSQCCLVLKGFACRSRSQPTAGARSCLSSQVNARALERPSGGVGCLFRNDSFLGALDEQA